MPARGGRDAKIKIGNAALLDTGLVMDPHQFVPKYADLADERGLMKMAITCYLLRSNGNRPQHAPVTPQRARNKLVERSLQWQKRRILYQAELMSILNLARRKYKVSCTK